MDFLTLVFAQSEPLNHEFFGLDADQRFVVLLAALGCATLLVLVLGCVTAAVWSSVRHKRIEADLKQEMLDRGMTTEEIERVIKARPTEGMDHWMEVWATRKK